MPNYRWWITTVVSPVLVTVAMVLFSGSGAGWSWTTGWFAGDGHEGALTVGFILTALGALAGPIWGGWHEKKREEDSVSALRTTLIPTAAALIHSAAHPPDSDKLRLILAKTMGELRNYVASNGTNADANFYLLDGSGELGTRLLRAHPTSTGARAEFRRNKGKDMASREQNEVVKRICNGVDAWCRDTRNAAQIEEFSLDPNARRNYSAFLSVPVSNPGNGSPIGMLSVNSDSKYVIQSHHLQYLYAIATLIGEYDALHDIRAIMGHTGTTGGES